MPEKLGSDKFSFGEFKDCIKSCVMQISADYEVTYAILLGALSDVQKEIYTELKQLQSEDKNNQQ